MTQGNRKVQTGHSPRTSSPAGNGLVKPALRGERPESLRLPWHMTVLEYRTLIYPLYSMRPNLPATHCRGPHLVSSNVWQSTRSPDYQSCLQNAVAQKTNSPQKNSLSAAVIGRLLRNSNVMWVALHHTRARDPDKLGIFEGFDGASTTVTHTCTEAA
jgi:hypothetical protein